MAYTSGKFKTPDRRYDVIIAGAGPVGLMLATELKLYGVKVLILEKRASYDETEKATSLSRGLIGNFDRRGLLPCLLAARLRLDGEDFSVEDSDSKYVYSDGKRVPDPITRIDRAHPLLKGRSEKGWEFFIPQVEVERVLVERGQKLGVTLHREAEVVAFNEYDSGVHVFAQNPSEKGSEGPKEDFWGKWLVGCDGGHSDVRRLANFDFAGAEATFSGRSAFVSLEGAENLALRRKGWTCTSTGIYSYEPHSGRLSTIELVPPVDRKAPVLLEEMEASIRRVSGIDGIKIKELTHAKRFGDTAKVAKDYRRRRVFLCGDAAHVHSPFGALGLKLGLEDAINLGWKLAAVVKGKPLDDGTTSENLLQSYTQERYPVGAAAVKASINWSVTMRKACEKVRLKITTGSTYSYAEDGSAQWFGYDLGNGTPLVGMKVPDIQVDETVYLSDCFHSGRGILLDLTGNNRIVNLISDRYFKSIKVVRGSKYYASMKVFRESKRILRRSKKVTRGSKKGVRWSKKGVRWNKKVAHGSRSMDGIEGLLVRPDGIVAWAATVRVCDIWRLIDALSRWFFFRK